jgi:pimeloyl-ACP methyl ester carboxylesterase
MAAVAVSCTPTMTRPLGEDPSLPNAPRPAEAQVPRRGGYVEASDGVRIYYEACGSGPAIVLVHGLGGNHAVWFQQVAHFATDHTVVTMSQRGFAPSGGDQNHYDVDLLVRDLTAVMDAAGVDRAVVVGQSMGGWTALRLALNAPTRVDALVLADTIGGIHDDEIAAGLRAVAASAATLRNQPPPLGVHPALSASFSQRRPDLAYLYQTLTTFGAPAPDAIVRQLFAARVGADRLAQLKVPTLFVVGSEDRLFPEPMIRRAASYIAGSQVAVIADSGHSPYFEQPAAWNAELKRFLKSR